MALSFKTPEEMYEYKRQRAAQQGQASGQMQKEAMSRKFAAMGQGNSGTELKLQSQLDQRVDEGIAGQQEGINAQEQQDRLARDEAQTNRIWGTAERVGSQLFSAGEAAVARGWQSGETQKQREFGAKEAQKQRLNDDRWKQATLDFETTKWGDQLTQVTRQYEEDVRVTDFNMNMANKIFNKRGMMEKVADPLGWGELPGTKGSGAPGWTGNPATYIPLTAGTGTFGF